MRSAERLYGRIRDARAVALTGLLRGGFQHFGARSRLSPPLRLSGSSRISIGDRVFIGEGCWLNCIETPESPTGPFVVVGDNVVMSGYCTISATRGVELGAGVILARGVYISDHGHARSVGATSAREPDGGRPVTLGAGVWVGQNACIMPGVRIGAGAIVGANSVVTRDIPVNGVAVGAPARVVKMLD